MCYHTRVVNQQLLVNRKLGARVVGTTNAWRGEGGDALQLIVKADGV